MHNRLSNKGSGFFQVFPSLMGASSYSFNHTHQRLCGNDVCQFEASCLKQSPKFRLSPLTTARGHNETHKYYRQRLEPSF
jgi:hypothetical protein